MSDPVTHDKYCDSSLHRPKLLYARHIARALSSADDPWDEQRARRFLKREGVGWKLGSSAGSPWVTTTDRLLEKFPHLVDLIVRELDEGRCHWCGRAYDE